MSSFYIIHHFTGYSSRQAELQIIGPFEDRKIATKYKKFTQNRVQAKSMHDFAVGSKVTTKVPEDDGVKAYYKFLPNEDLLCELWSEA